MSYLGRSSNFGVRSRFIYTASGSETSISGADDNNNSLSFTDGAYVDVYLNGVLLVPNTDYNTTTANTIGGLSALAASDVVEIVVYDAFNVADTVPASTGGTFNGNVTANAFYGDGSNLTGLAASFNQLTDTTVSTSDPTISSNPSATGHLWLNKTSGEVYVCIDATTGANVWSNVGLGTGDIVGPYNIEYVLVAGGGGAGATQANYDAGTGGGGAGGYKSSVSGESSGGGTSALSPITVSQADVVTIVVGGGGAGQTADTHNRGGAGTDSTLAVTGQSTITAIGGGGGGTTGADTLNEAAGGSGGSGGGATSYNSTAQSGGSGTSGQGYDGGDLVFTSVTYNGAGGGGAGSAGQDAINNSGTLVGGNGGSGVTSSITGTAVGRAGGGGGGGRSGDASGTGTDGGANGGATVGGSGGGAGYNAEANKGGGGGGAYGAGLQNGGSGGSGVCILKIPTAYYTGTYTGTSVVESTVGDYTILQFNDSGSYTA